MLRTYLEHISFDLPLMLLLLLGIPALGYHLTKNDLNRQPAFLLGSTGSIARLRQKKIIWRHLPIVLRLLAAGCLIVAMARPASYTTLEVKKGNGIDIMLCLDVSGSMLARDFTPDRLTASVNVARQFVNRRKGDRIGLVIFSGQSLSLCPLTTDHRVVLNQLGAIKYGDLADGTAIGSGLASAVDRQRGGNARSKVIILLTDGENTGGVIDPPTARELAKTFGIRVYTIGVGTTGFAPMPYQTPTGATVLQQEKVSIDENLLTDIALQTGGQYFRATDTKTLENIYANIDQLEKTKVESSVFRKRTDEFFPWVMAALILVVLEVTIQLTWLKKLS